VKRKDKATQVCLERAMFSVYDGRSVWLLGYEGPAHYISTIPVKDPHTRI
jgi:hypothetical protein